MKTALQVILDLHSICKFMSIERKEVATNGEIRRWFDQKAIEVNFEPIGFKDEWPPVIKSIVMFPKSKKRRCTLYFDESITLIQVKGLT